MYRCRGILDRLDPPTPEETRARGSAACVDFENVEGTGDMGALTAYVNEALESLDPHLSSLRRDSGSAALVV